MRDRVAVIVQLFQLLWAHRSWWLLPAIVGLAVVALLTVTSAASPLAPFLYPLF